MSAASIQSSMNRPLKVLPLVVSNMVLATDDPPMLRTDPNGSEEAKRIYIEMSAGDPEGLRRTPKDSEGPRRRQVSGDVADAITSTFVLEVK